MSDGARAKTPEQWAKEAADSATTAAKNATKYLELPVAEVETEYYETKDKDGEKETIASMRVRLKGQRPNDECILEFGVPLDTVKTIHEAKKRNGTIWVRFGLTGETPGVGPGLTNGRLVVGDLLE